MPYQDDPRITAPDDFTAFWRTTLDQLQEIDPQTHATNIATRTDIEHIEINCSSWQQIAIQGYLLRHLDDQPHPLVIYTHGYNSQYEVLWQWAQQGFNVCGFDTRGFGRSVMTTDTAGWILTGIESAEQNILRGAVCDYIRVAQVARHLAGSSNSRTLYYGYSFGGAMALMAAALDQGADVVAAGVPSFGWMEGRRRLVKQGSGHEVNSYLQQHPKREATVMNTLAYFDTCNFAPLITAPTLIGLGKVDHVVPPETVRAIAQRLQAPHRLMEFPYSHSDQPEEEWQVFEKAWQRLALSGELN